MQNKWVYSIESYRWTPSEGAFVPANEADADTWFLFGEGEGDKRVFGLFSSHLAAEEAAVRLSTGKAGKQYEGEFNRLSGYDRMMSEAANRGSPKQDKEIER